ncbi:FAD-dependent oxidoreductase [Chryseobacterium sp. LAM-KRS1]|uniref:FAD-dependent oxidoreductase n=1 Tax=Chryseobacterium sp. LAM-KRS1 TaxID=2715754 RepID=UPI00155282EF|nr:FAD-dependent monooxygenase [Chryseobacterium sp. LAM-KRS1]
MEENRKAIILGAGIAGTAMALFLEKIGISSEIFELRSREETAGGGLNIAPNGMNVLAELGLAEEIIQSGCPVHEGVFRNGKGKRLAKMLFTDLQKFPQPAVSMKRQTLVDILRKAVRTKNIPLYFEKKVKDIVQTDDGKVIVSFDDDTVSIGDLLIGADGINSEVRKSVAPEIQPEFTGIISHAGFISKDKLAGLTDREFRNINFIYGKNGFFGFSGANDKELMWWTNVISEMPWSKDQLKNIHVDEEKEVLNKQYGNYSFPVSDIINNADSYLRINVFDVRFLPVWSHRKIILIGDAAHAVSPNSGQGASMALEDAMLLAKLLRDQKECLSAFSLFEQERRPRVEKIVLEGRRRGEDKVVVNGFKQFIRETMIRIFINLFGSKGNDWLFSYKIKW